jgi:hypothetical protein
MAIPKRKEANGNQNGRVTYERGAVQGKTTTVSNRVAMQRRINMNE